MAGEAKDRSDFSDFLFGFSPFMGPLFPFVPPTLLLQMWLPLALGTYREFLEYYRKALTEWKDEDVDQSLRLMGNDLLRTSLAAMKASREYRSKLAEFQLESIERYLKFLDKFPDTGDPKRPA